MIKTSAGRKAAMLAAAISASVAGTAPVAAIAQDGFPQPGRQLRIIVPFTAGGSSDVQARMLADRLSRLWGQPVVVENKPDRKSTRLNSSHSQISYAVFCLKKIKERDAA